MAEKVIMPRQGLQMTEGTITSWLVEEGGTVTKGEPLFEIETDKLTITIDANSNGKLLKIIHGEGEVVPVATTIAIIGEPGEDYKSLLIDEKADERIFVTPRAKMRAEELNLDYNLVPGTGPQGLITERDILGYHAANNNEVSQKVPDATIIPLSTMRQVIAKRMHESLQTMAQANHRMTADMTEAVKIREQFRVRGTKVSYNHIVLRCVAKALTEFPIINSSLTDGAIIQKGYVHLGLAVAVNGGLVVPVLRNADLMTLPQIAAAADQLIAKARNGELEQDDYTGGTFTVSNLGMFEVDSFTAIINPPEAGILAVGKISKKPVVTEDDSIVIRSLMELSLTYDHRVVDGAPAAKFLRRIKTLLENPWLLI